MLLLTAFALATRKMRFSREVLFLVVPPVLYMLMSMTSQLNIGVRHILLVFVFCCVLAAGGAWALIRSNRRWIWPVGRAAPAAHRLLGARLPHLVHGLLQRAVGRAVARPTST